MLFVEIVDDNKIKVGTCRHLPRPESAEREDRGRLAAYAPVRGGEIGFHAGVQPADEDIGKTANTSPACSADSDPERIAHRSGTCAPGRTDGSHRSISS